MKTQAQMLPNKNYTYSTYAKNSKIEMQYSK